MKLKIISDGTNGGTKLIDEDTGETVHGIGKLTWEASATEVLTKATVEFFNIPVEIVSKAEVDLYECKSPNWGMEFSKSFEKNVKLESKLAGSKAVLNTDTKITDADTNELVGAVQEVKWEATPEGIKTKVKRLKFDNKDW
jgi:hypothetical protein